jgi:hypothetical protein
MEAYTVPEPVPSYPEWIIQVKAAKAMLEFFPEMFTDRQKELFYTKREMSVISSIYYVALEAKKCRELNSIEYLVTPIRTLEGWQRVTYYNTGDVVFVTVPGKHEGQKLVTAIFSLTQKLGQLESIRRAAEKSGRKNVPMGRIRKLRKNPKARGFFAQKN